MISKTEGSELANRFNSVKRVIAESAFSEPKGTRVVLKNLFASNEIRKARLKNNLESELSACTELVTLYGSVFHDVEFRFFSIDEKGRSKCIFSKAKFEDEMSNLCSIFGTAAGKSLHMFEAGEDDIEIRGYLSNPFRVDTPIVDKNKVYVAINRRPINKLPSIKRLLNSILEQKTGKRNVFAVLFIYCPISNVEVNIEKSKMNVRFKDDTKIRNLISKSAQNVIDELYSNSIREMPAPIPKARISFESQMITRQFQESSDISGHIEQADPSKTPEKPSPFDQIEGSRVQTLAKKNLKDLVVLGQFNKGFIICSLNGNDEQIFVIDQHAADEKTTYEGLINKAQLSKQKLSNPILVKLTSFEMLLVDKHIETFSRFGFELQSHPNQDVLDILSFPQYEDNQYGLAEFHELLRALKSCDSTESFQFQKLRDLLASNACRYSIMIGQVLSEDQLISITRNLSTLTAPFNCPHGRPTLFQTKNAFVKQQLNNQINDYLFRKNS